MEDIETPAEQVDQEGLQNTRKLLASFAGDPLKQEFVLINFSSYCGAENQTYIPAEVALASFSMEKGLIDNYSTLIDPGSIPRNFAVTARASARTLGNPAPPFQNGCRNYAEILRNIDRFMKNHPCEEIPNSSTCLFCLRSEIDIVQGCLNWLTQKCGVTMEFRICSFSLLLQQFARFGKEYFLNYLKTIQANQYIQGYHKNSPVSAYSSGTESIYEPDLLAFVPPSRIDDGRFRARRIPNASARYGCAPKSIKIKVSEVSENALPVLTNFDDPKSQDSERAICDQLFMSEELAEEFLKSYDLAFCLELGCQHHMVNRKGVSTCALNVVNRYAFNTIDILIGYFPTIEPVEECHYPLMNVKDERRKRRKMLELWGRGGYKNLHGFNNSAVEPRTWTRGGKKRRFGHAARQFFIAAAQAFRRRFFRVR